MRAASEQHRQNLPAACVGAVGCAGGAGCFMALRSLGWSCRQPTRRKATGTTRTAERPAGFFPPALSPPSLVGTGKKLAFASEFEVPVFFLGGIESRREEEE